MFFDSQAEIAEIARRSGTSVFVVPDPGRVKIPGAIVLEPEEKKASITIDQVRNVIEVVAKRQLEDLFVLVRPAEQMRAEAANALLKTLEQPGDKVHFVLATSQPAQILPTILSRAMIYYLRPRADFLQSIAGNEKQKALARRLITAQGSELVEAVAELTKKREGVQRYALEVLAIAVEMAYKSYLATRKAGFLAKIPGLTRAYEDIAVGGNIKLQIVAELG